MKMHSTPNAAGTGATRRRLLKLLAVPLIAGACMSAPAFAQDAYPSKPVKFVVNFPAGGPVDVLARLVASKVGTSLKQSVYVENISGAAGSVGASNVARADPDGYTVLFSIDTPFTMNPSLYPSLPFKLTDLKPVIMMGSSGSTIAVNPATGINSLKDLIARGKKEEINFSSAGVGSPGHLAISMLNDATGTHISHIPYRGNTPAVQALVGGQVQGGILATTGMLPYIKAGKIKALAVAAPKRSVVLPDVPTTAELGYRNVELQFFFVAMVPSKTPDAIAQKLQTEIAKVLAQKDIQDRLHNLDIVVDSMPGPEAADLLAQYRERYGKIIKATGMKIQ